MPTALDTAQTTALLPQQSDPSAPSVSGLRRSSNLLVPDYLTGERLAHFPAEMYDLRPSSHLVRFVRALLGDSGAGSARKRYLIARIQQSPRGAHFGDLERFYGTLLNVGRLLDERYAINPFVDLATGDEWDAIHSADSRYRERIYSLARAIPMGATIPGLKTAAEALVGVPCDVHETWRSIDWLHGHGFRTPDDYWEGRSWDQVEALGTYDELDVMTWADITGIPMVDQTYDDITTNELTYNEMENYTWGGLESRPYSARRVKNDRGALVVRPVRSYDLLSPYARQEKAQDDYVLRRALGVLKPASARLVVDQSATGVFEPAPINNVICDSNYYEVIARVTPSPTVDGSVYPVTRGQQAQGVLAGDQRVLPRPPFTASSGGEWHYNNEVVSVRSYAESASVGHAVVEAQAYEYTSDIYGRVTAYPPTQGVLDPRRAEAGRLSNDTALQSHPYAADRRLVPTNG